jgi:hypothetical protein
MGADRIRPRKLGACSNSALVFSKQFGEVRNLVTKELSSMLAEFRLPSTDGRHLEVS